MKKIALPLVAGVALFFNACGDNDMEDTALKSKKYYQTHLDEAENKLKWCFEKLDIPYDFNIKNLVEFDNKIMKKADSFSYSEKINTNEMRGIDIYNCRQVGLSFKGKKY